MAEAVIRHNLWSAEVLELGGISTSLSCQADEVNRAFQAAVVVGGNICDEIGGVLVPDQSMQFLSIFSSIIAPIMPKKLPSVGVSLFDSPQISAQLLQKRLEVHALTRFEALRC